MINWLICVAYTEKLSERLGHWHIMTGLILAVVGFIVSVSAFRIVKLFKKAELDRYDKSVIILKVAGLGFVIAGFVLAMFF